MAGGPTRKEITKITKSFAKEVRAFADTLNNDQRKEMHNILKTLKNNPFLLNIIKE